MASWQNALEAFGTGFSERNSEVRALPSPIQPKAETGDEWSKKEG
jgi:hypothetical protein